MLTTFIVGLGTVLYLKTTDTGKHYEVSFEVITPIAAPVEVTILDSGRLVKHFKMHEYGTSFAKSGTKVVFVLEKETTKN